jgi:uncharacterized membrane protein YccC
MRLSFPAHDPTGLHYAVRIFMGTALLWFLLRWAGNANPIWAVISLIVVMEPKVSGAWLAFLSRTANTVIGCAAGLLFLLLDRNADWILPAAVAVTVLVCTYLVRLPLSWRIAPVTAALVIASDMADPTPWGGLEIALRRTGEVLLGSAAALLVTWLVSMVWPQRDAPEKTGGKEGGAPSSLKPGNAKDAEGDGPNRT